MATGAQEPDDETHPGPATDELLGLLAGVRERLAEPREQPLAALARRVGVDAESLRRLFAAAGRLHDDDRYGQRDVVYAEGIAELLQRFELAALERAFRANQRSMTSLAVNQLTLVPDDRRLRPLVDRADRAETAGTLADEARRTLDVVQRLLLEDHEEALLRLLDSQVVADASRTLGEVLDVAVAFVDLVGFTRLSATADPGSVSETLGAFEDVVHREAQRVGEVLVVKFIGDAAMLLGAEVDRVADCALAVVEADDEGISDVARRAGLAAGEVRSRDGDYVGTPVNLAARLTDLARPESLVAGPEAVDRLDEGAWRRSRLPARRLKGLGRVRAQRVRRANGPPAGA